MASSSTQPNISTSTPKYLPPHRRHERTTSSSSRRGSRSHSPSYRRGQPFLTYEDLHAKYSPPNSPPLRIPRAQRSLSAEDLYRRYHTQPNQPQQGENQSQHGQIQGHDPPNISEPPPPSQPRDLRALRRPRSPSLPRQAPRQQLSARLPDPPVFNGSDRSKFEDWKLRIENKLSLNEDHYPTEAFKIEYVISRLSGKATEHTVPRRRKLTAKPYVSVDDLFQHLSDLYETPLRIQEDASGYICEDLKQGAEQSFPDFYAEFMRHAGQSSGYSSKHLAMYLQRGLNKRLTNACQIMGKYWTNTSLSDLKEYLTGVDYLQRNTAEQEAKDKAKNFARQYALARQEAAVKPPGKYVILARPDREEYKR